MTKQCKSFAGMVNFVSIFCPELQKLLKPIYDLTRKDKQFVWGVEQQSAFEDVYCKMIIPYMYLYKHQVEYYEKMVYEIMEKDIGLILPKFEDKEKNIE